jgi:5-methyltetrahydropteroyltriglutamate--homocysteine methyltransferase
MSVRTTTLGWFPKPPALARARRRHADGEIDDAALVALEDEAMAAALRLQEQLGLDLLVDGQLDRADLVSHFAERLGGIESRGFVRCFDNRYYRKPAVVDEIAWSEPVTVERWRRAAAATSRPVRAIVTGPYTLMDWSFDEHYGSRERCCMAFAEAVRREVEALAAAGAGEIEVAEPAAGARADEDGLVVEAMAQATAGLDRGRVRLWTNVGYGIGSVPRAWLARMPVDVVLLATDHDVELPDGRELGLGLVDALDPRVEPVESIRERLTRVAARVPADRLWVTPGAGLRTLDEPALRAKLQNLVAAARQVG